MSESAFERAVAAQFEAVQTFNALVAGQDFRAMKTEEIRPGLMVYPAKTDAPCSNCGKTTTNQLIRRGNSGPFHASCNDTRCMNAITRGL
jgi:hypothetical protein